jgi:hypothetical protein
MPPAVVCHLLLPDLTTLCLLSCQPHRRCSQALDVFTLLFCEEVVVYEHPWFPRHQLHPGASASANTQLHTVYVMNPSNCQDLWALQGMCGHRLPAGVQLRQVLDMVMGENRYYINQ